MWLHYKVIIVNNFNIFFDKKKINNKFLNSFSVYYLS